MSLSSIMSSGADPEPPIKTQRIRSITSHSPRLSKPSPTDALFVKSEAMASPAPADQVSSEPFAHSRGYEAVPPVTLAPPTHRVLPRELPVPDEADVEVQLARIETMEMSDVDGPGFEADKEEYIQRGRKRALEADDSEAGKRKVSLHKRRDIITPLTIRSGAALPPCPASLMSSILTATPSRRTTKRPTSWMHGRSYRTKRLQRRRSARRICNASADGKRPS